MNGEATADLAGIVERDAAYDPLDLTNADPYQAIDDRRVLLALIRETRDALRFATDGPTPSDRRWYAVGKVLTRLAALDPVAHRPTPAEPPTIGDCSCVDAKGSNPHCAVHHPAVAPAEPGEAT